jgi:hypothetical protein
MTINRGDVVTAQWHLSVAIDYLQSVIDMLEGGKDTDMEIDLLEAEANAVMAQKLIAKIQPTLFAP